jgi:hypothetical protein
MSAAAGLPLPAAHGAFYSQFKSKEAVVAEALGLVLEESRESWARDSSGQDKSNVVEMIIDGYLSPRHRDSLGTGCAVAALGSEPRSSAEEVSQRARTARPAPGPRRDRSGLSTGSGSRSEPLVWMKSAGRSAAIRTFPVASAPSSARSSRVRRLRWGATTTGIAGAASRSFSARARTARGSTPSLIWRRTSRAWPSAVRRPSDVSLAALLRGEVVHVPGRANRVAASLLGFAPRAAGHRLHRTPRLGPRADPLVGLCAQRSVTTPVEIS